MSDYGKGVCTRGLLESIGTRAHEADIPILVDPARSRDCSDYGQVSLITANWAEASEAGSSENLRPLALARKLSDAQGCHVVVTIGRHGLVCAERSGAIWHLPATPTEVRDVCGAGDTVLATLAVGISTGKSLRAACQAACQAACRAAIGGGGKAGGCGGDRGGRVNAKANSDAVRPAFDPPLTRVKLAFRPSLSYNLP